MSEIGEHPVAPLLPATFTRLLATGSPDLRSGTLLVTGDPGGSFHLRDGAVVEVTSPGAPGVDTLLLRSGRISEADWASALHADSAGPGPDGIGAELVARELVGAAEWQLICVMAALDGALAVGMGRIDDLTLHPDRCGHCAAAPEGIDPEWLFRETGRRIAALRSSGPPLSPFHDRLSRTDAGTALLGRSATGDRRDILRRADGRRSARDLAFVLGRSLYAVTVEVSRLLAEGLLAPAPPSADRPEPPGPARDEPPPPRPARLPHRVPGASGITDVLPLRPVADAWQPPPALLAKYRAAGAGDDR